MNSRNTNASKEDSNTNNYSMIKDSTLEKKTLTQDMISKSNPVELNNESQS